MAEHTQNALVYYAAIDVIYKDKLGSLRLWTNLKLAYDGETIWLKDLTEEQTSEHKLRSIPSCSIYVEKNNKLYPKDSLLPCGNIPSLLWTPIFRAVPVTLPRYNDNFMGLGEDNINIRLVPSSNMQDVFAMITDVAELGKYIETAPASRLRELRWTILSDRNVFIAGTPLLPIKGNVFWRYKQLLLPAGFDFNYPILSDYINKLYTSADLYICWLNQENYIKIDITQLEYLSIASFRKSYRALENI